MNFTCTGIMNMTALEEYKCGELVSMSWSNDTDAYVEHEDTYNSLKLLVYSDNLIVLHSRQHVVDGSPYNAAYEQVHSNEITYVVYLSLIYSNSNCYCRVLTPNGKCGYIEKRYLAPISVV